MLGKTDYTTLMYVCIVNHEHSLARFLFVEYIFRSKKDALRQYTCSS